MFVREWGRAGAAIMARVFAAWPFVPFVVVTWREVTMRMRARKDVRMVVVPGGCDFQSPIARYPVIPHDELAGKVEVRGL